VRTVLIQASEALAGLVARIAPALAAVRIGPDRSQPGLLWQPDLLLTAEARLPADNSCPLVRPGGSVVPGRLALRDRASGIAAIRLATPATASPLGLASPPGPGALAVLIGTTETAEPTARLAMVHAAATGAAARLVLDTPLPESAIGGPVLDAAGQLLGLAVPGPEGLAGVVPHALLAALLAAAPASDPVQRGWLGLSLQPVLKGRGMGWLMHSRGRRVVRVEPGSPGALAGIAVGDTLVAIDGRSINGQGSLREFLTAESIGRTVELRLDRNDKVETRRVTVAARPAA
jgi:S1-C subfamily serine protease